jgi:ankyrin repeat protein
MTINWNDPIWDAYRERQNIDELREDILTSPWYRLPQRASDSLLMRAIESSDLNAVKLLISLGESPSMPEPSGFTCLHQAIDNASKAELGPASETALAIIVALLEGGADPNAQGIDGTPLHRAAGWGLVEAARMLLAHGADIEARMLIDGELTPLMHAALMGQPLMVRVLLDAGANPLAVAAPYVMHGSATLRDLLTEANVLNRGNVRNKQQILDILAERDLPHD